MFVTFNKGPKKQAYGKSHVFNLKLDNKKLEPEPVLIRDRRALKPPTPINLSMVKVKV